MTGVVHRAIVPYLVALGAVLVVVVLRFALGPVLGQGAPLVLFLLAVSFSAWYGGFGPGVAATVVGMFLGFALFSTPAQAEADPHGAVAYWLARGLPFVFVGAAISFFSARLEAARADAKSRAMRAYDSEEFVRRVIASSPDCIKVFDLEGRLLSINDNGARLLEIADSGPLLGCRWPDWWQGEQRSSAQQAVERARNGLTNSFITSAPTFGGMQKWWDVSVSPIMGVDGKPERLLSVSRDISARRDADDALRRSGMQIRQLADAMPQIVWTANPDGTLDYYNQRWFEYIDRPADSIEDARWDRYIHPEDLQRTYDAWQASVQSGEPYGVEFRVRRADGQYRWFLARALASRDESGSIARWFGTCTDIHDQRELQMGLERSEALFRQLADTIPQLAWMANPDGGIFWYNHRWYDYTGTQPEQMQGWGWQRVHDPEVLPAVTAKWQACMLSGEPFDMTFPLRGADGQFRPFLTRVMPFRDAANRIALWFGTNTDVSEQRRMVEERDALLSSERAARNTAEHASRMKDEFLATVSHELRTPLSAILGWAQVLIARQLPGEELNQALEAIQRNARVQTQLIEDLLDMSRIISGKLRLDVQTVQPLSFVEAAIETVLPAATAKSIRLEKVLDPLAGPVAGDPGRLQQIIWNLLSNAIKFTPRGGRVQVLLERVNSHIEISVSDTGQGIAAEFLPRVFDPFLQADSSTTRKHGGLGLGLAIVRHLTELHGGTVRVKSAGERQGTTFNVHLPVKISRADEGDRLHPRAAIATAPGLATVDLSGLKIVVVDDEPDTRMLLKRLLEGYAAQVEIAASASEGLAMIRSCHPDVLISDIGMPEMDGYQFLQKVRALDSSEGGKTPAIALTAFARSEDRIRAMLAGYMTHVSKPVEPAELAATIAALVGRTGGIAAS